MTPIGWTCAYTPLAIIDAAGLVPHRLLPMGEPPDQAGRLLHENLCPHVKVVLDRALDEDLPPLSGVVFTTSCDTMRRLADAWPAARPDDPIHVIDLPLDDAVSSISYFAGELRRLAAALAEWGGREVTEDRLRTSGGERDKLAALLAELGERRSRGELPGGAARLQQLQNQAATATLDEAIRMARDALDEPLREPPARGVPILLFGNVMPDPESLGLLEESGALVKDDDLCTGSRWLTTAGLTEAGDPFEELARAYLTRPPCARTVSPSEPGRLAFEIVSRARGCRARGVVCHTLKFCDPYLARLPALREALRDEGLPLLVLEGDLTLRSLGQQRTRIEAFLEMLA